MQRPESMSFEDYKTARALTNAAKNVATVLWDSTTQGQYRKSVGLIGIQYKTGTQKRAEARAGAIA
jgi:hypothetical protein